MSAVIALEGLAAAINREHDLALEHASTALEHACRVGQMLITAKDECAHGEWLTWIVTKTKVSVRQSQRYMRLAQADTTRVSHLSQRQALAELANPKPQSTVDMQVDDNDDCDKAPFWQAFRKAAASGALRDASARLKGSSVPLEAGQVTIGHIGGEPAFVLLESRKHRGYWHDIDVRTGSASARPMRALGLQWRIACNPDTAAAVWATTPDEGQFLELVEA